MSGIDGLDGLRSKLVVLVQDFKLKYNGFREKTSFLICELLGQDNLGHLSHENEVLTEKIMLLQDEIQCIISSYEAKIKNFEAIISSLNLENTELSGQITELKNLNVALEIGNRKWKFEFEKHIDRLKEMEISETLKTTALNLVNEVEAMNILTEDDLKTMKVLCLDKLKKIFKADAVSIFLISPDGESMFFDIVNGGAEDIKINTYKQPKYNASDELNGIGRGCAANEIAVTTDDVWNHPWYDRASAAKLAYPVKNMMCIPLKIGGKVIGVIQIMNKYDELYTDAKKAEMKKAVLEKYELKKAQGDIGAEQSIRMLTSHYKGEFTDDESQVLELISNIIGKKINHYLLIRAKEDKVYSILAGMVNAFEKQDPYTAGHSHRVSTLFEKFLVSIKDSYKINGEKIRDEDVRLGVWAAKLHDLGKMHVDPRILHKPGKLTDEQFKIIRKHPKFTMDILEGCRYESRDKSYAMTSIQDQENAALEKIGDWAMFHHERIDGKGYPDGALCDEIPFMSKILALVDVYDAMRSKRPYRNPMKKEEILEEFLKNKGTQFDAELADLFVEFMNSQAAVDDFGLYTGDEYENNIEYFSVEQVIEQLRKSYILSAEEEKNIISFFKALENKKGIRFDADFIKDYGDNHLVKK